MMDTGMDSSKPRARSTSGPAILGTLVAVAIAVLVGVFGPDMGGRGIVPEGVPLGSIVENLGELHRFRVASDEVPQSRWRDAARALGADRVPEPPVDAWSFRGARIEDRPGSDELAPTIVAVFERDGGPADEPIRLSIAAVADGGRTHHYDGFVRSRPLLDGEVLRFAPTENTSGSAVLVFVDDPIVWVVHCDDESVLDEIADGLLGREVGDEDPPEERRVRADLGRNPVVFGRLLEEGMEEGLDSPIPVPYS